MTSFPCVYRSYDLKCVTDMRIATKVARTGETCPILYTHPSPFYNVLYLQPTRTVSSSLGSIPTAADSRNIALCQDDQKALPSSRL